MGLKSRTSLNQHSFRSLCATLLALTLMSCASHNNRPAPVEDRSSLGRPAGAVSSSEPSKPLPGIENAGKPGYQTVKPGDTLIRIGQETGQNWKDLLKWNNLENANVLEVGQVIRVAPPGVDPSAVAVRPIVSSKVETRPLDAVKTPNTSASAPVSAASSVGAPAPVVAPVPTPAPQGEDELNWQWPAAGSVLSGFEEARSKGLSIGGKAGDPVLAAAEGRVVYAGSGLRGYGNLVIVKHNNTYLSAYAHNQKLLVKEEQTVKRGQKIAEIGSTDSDKVQLHFEIRRLGKPVDPAKLLPAR